MKEDVRTNMFEDVVVEESTSLLKGKYTGTVRDIIRDSSKYDYTRYTVDIDGVNTTINLSYPTKVTFNADGEPTSQHAKFLVKLGIKANAGIKFGLLINQIIGKKISFMIENIERNGTTYYQINKESIKLFP